MARGEKGRKVTAKGKSLTGQALFKRRRDATRQIGVKFNETDHLFHDS